MFPRFLKSLLLFLGGFTLTVFLFVLFMLGYFLFSYKGKDMVNFVFLGEGGAGHEGSDLTDSIIFSSVSKNGITNISIPRDLWYQPWQTKVNTLYYFGRQKGNGFEFTKEILGEITGQKIDHTILINFQVFEDLVNLVGGVEVPVDRSFDDFFYPIAGKENDLCSGDKQLKCRYEHIHFDTGLQYMNGKTALKFIRSRNAQGDEGTDSARSARQQKVILALKERLMSPDFFLSISKIQGLEKIVKERFRGDLPDTNDLLGLGKILLNPRARRVNSFVLDSWQTNEGLIYHPQKHASGQWVLLPKDSSWLQINNFIDCLIYQENKSSCSQTQTQVIQGR